MANKNTKEMSFLDHLEEVRWLLVRSTAAILICATVAFFFSDFIFNEIILALKVLTLLRISFFVNYRNNLV